MAAGASVQLLELRKRYGAVVALDTLSLDVKQGEFITLLGPSGSGKTTTLMMIAGFEEPPCSLRHDDHVPPLSRASTAPSSARP